MKKVNKIVIFVSGNGSNMSNIMEHFRINSSVIISHVFSNKKDCMGIKNAKKEGVNTCVFSKTELESGKVTSLLQEIVPDLIVLAGFLWKIPKEITQIFPDKIINVHPALLPKFGGKGMYGNHVHKAVIEANESKTGITFHFVNEQYDEGNIIDQFECAVNKKDTWEDVQSKVQQLEHTYFPKVIENLLQKTNY